MFDLTEAGFSKYARHLIGCEERGEDDIQAGGEECLFRLRLRSGTTKVRTTSDPDAQPAAQRRVSLIEAGDRYWVTPSQEMKAGASGAKPVSANASAIELRSKSHGVNLSCRGGSNPSVLKPRLFPNLHDWIIHFEYDQLIQIGRMTQCIGV